MTAINVEEMDSVIRHMLDSMRNAHLQMVLGDATQAIAHLHDAAGAHRRLAVMFHGNPDHEAIAGRVLFRIIDQRMESLMSLARDYLDHPMPAEEIIAFVAKPLDPT